MVVIEEVLKNVGLTQHESAVYVALCRLGEATAYKIAQECDVKKPTVYVTLEDLRKKGLVLKVPHAKKQVFSAHSIEDYIVGQETNLKRARSVLPVLQQMSSAPHSRVLYFSGLKGLKEAMDFKLESMRGETFHSFYEDLTGSDVARVSELYTKWDEKAFSMGTSFAVIMERPSGKRPYYRELLRRCETNDQVRIKFLKAGAYPPNVSIEIAKDFVRITNDKILQCTIIDDKQTADAMRQIFQIVWQKGV